MARYRKSDDAGVVIITDNDGTETIFSRDGDNVCVRIKPKRTHIDDAEAAYMPMDWVVKAILDVARFK